MTITILEVIIGLGFTYLLLSLICSAINEALAGMLGWRAHTLAEGMRRLLTDARMRRQFYLHPLITSLGRGKTTLCHKPFIKALGLSGVVCRLQGADLHEPADQVSPSYIPARLFALVLLDVLAPAGRPKPEGILALRQVIELLPPSYDTLKRVLYPLLTDANIAAQLPEIRAAIRQHTAVDTAQQQRLLRLADDVNSPQTVESLRATLLLLAPPHRNLQQALLALVDSADNDLAGVRLNVEGWFNDAMDRVGGWYKRKVQRVLLLLALLVSVLLNADSIALTQSLWYAPAARAAAVAATEQYINEVPPDEENAVSRIVALRSELSALGLALGWTRANLNLGFWGWASKLAGLFITTIAVSFGAPFWFDLLNKLGRLKATGQAPPKEATMPGAAS